MYSDYFFIDTRPLEDLASISSIANTKYDYYIPDDYRHSLKSSMLFISRPLEDIPVGYSNDSLQPSKSSDDFEKKLILYIGLCDYSIRSGYLGSFLQLCSSVYYFVQMRYIKLYHPEYFAYYVKESECTLNENIDKLISKKKKALLFNESWGKIIVFNEDLWRYYSYLYADAFQTGSNC